MEKQEEELDWLIYYCIKEEQTQNLHDGKGYLALRSIREHQLHNRLPIRINITLLEVPLLEQHSIHVNGAMNGRRRSFQRVKS